MSRIAVRVFSGGKTFAADRPLVGTKASRESSEPRADPAVRGTAATGAGAGASAPSGFYSALIQISPR